MGVPATTGALKTKVSEMQIGDYIPFSYLPALNTIWSLGKAAMGVEAPFAGRAFSDTGSNDAYFVKVAKGLLISDRVLAHTISWDALNTRKDIQGRPWNLDSIIPAMTSDIAPTGKVTASGHSYNDLPYKAFDKSTDVTARSYWFLQAGGADYTSKWIQYEFPAATEVSALSLVTTASTGTSNGIYKFRLEGSNDGTNYDLLIDGTHPNGTTEKMYYSMDKTVKYKYYRLSGYGYSSGHILITEIGLHEYTGTIRSLTGGVAYADANGNMSLTDKGFGAWPTNNEWDKYIVNFPADKIQSGKTLDDVFHWNSYVANWTQDTPSISLFPSTQRTARGHGASNGTTFVISSQQQSNRGFRPVFEYKEV